MTHLPEPKQKLLFSVSRIRLWSQILDTIFFSFAWFEDSDWFLPENRHRHIICILINFQTKKNTKRKPNQRPYGNLPNTFLYRLSQKSYPNPLFLFTFSLFCSEQNPYLNLIIHSSVTLLFFIILLLLSFFFLGYIGEILSVGSLLLLGLRVFFSFFLSLKPSRNRCA